MGKINKKIILKIVGVTFIIASAFLLSYFIIAKDYIAIQPSSEKRLKSLPYATWTKVDEKDLEKAGVTKYVPELSYQGLNFFSYDEFPGAFIMGMSGQILHRWLYIDSDEEIPFDVVRMCPNGDLLAIDNYKGYDKANLIRLDWFSNIKWINIPEGDYDFHHDITIADNGDIYTLTQKEEYIPSIKLDMPIVNDYITILTSDGELKRKISLAKAILKSGIPLSKIKKLINDMDPDDNSTLHANTAGIIDRDIFIGDKILFKKGNVVFCARNLNLIAVMDLEKENIIWNWGMDELDYPHQPSLLENGNILIFDNGFHRKYSRVIELDSYTKKIIWEYKADPPELFWSCQCGDCQRLPNGNTLITESWKGHVFEVTSDGKIVWEFYNPRIDENNKRKRIYRMRRITNLERHLLPL